MYQLQRDGRFICNVKIFRTYIFLRIYGKKKLKEQLINFIRRCRIRWRFFCSDKAIMDTEKLWEEIFLLKEENRKLKEENLRLKKNIKEIYICQNRERSAANNS